MAQIKFSKFKAKYEEILDEVARTGDPVTVTRKGRPFVQIVAAGPSKDELRAIDAADGSLDLDDDVVEDEELWENEETTREWDALNSAIGRDVSEAETKDGVPAGKSAKRRASSGKPAAKPAKAKARVKS